MSQELARNLSFLDVFTLGLGTMIGAGIFVLPSIAAANAGPASMLSFLGGGIVSLLAAISLSELATAMPQAGGSYVYVNKALGSLFGSIVGWGMWAGLMFASAFYMFGFAYYLTFFHEAVSIIGAALAMSALLVVVNYRGADSASRLQGVLVIVLLGVILAFVGAGVFRVDLQTLRPFNPHGWGNVAATIGVVYVTFIGFEVIASSAEEVRDPSRNLPLSMIAAVAVPTVLYMLVMLVSTGVMPLDDLVSSNIPVADAAELFLGPWGALLMVIGAVLATVSSANASILSAARINFAMGRDGVLSDWLNAVHDEHHTPYRSILVTGLVILALIAADAGLDTLAEVASFTYLVTYLLVHIAVVVMRRAGPEEYDPAFRIPDALYPWVPIAGGLACLAILVQMSLIVQSIGSVLIAASVGWYALYAREHAGREQLLGEAIAAPAEQAASTARHSILVPIANPETERALLRFAAASAHARGGDDAEIVAVNVVEVPHQTSLQQEMELEEERLQRQQELLDAARGPTEAMGVRLKTRAMLARDVGETIVNLADDEGVDQIVMGWDGTGTRRGHAMGRNIDTVVDDAACEITLITRPTEETSDVLVLVGEGPHSIAAARRGQELASAEVGTVPLKLVNVQSPGSEEDEPSPEDRGRQLIADVAAEAGIEADGYEAEVLVAEDVHAAVLDAAEDADTVVLGETRAGLLRRALSERLPGLVASRAPGTVAVVRTPEAHPRGVLRAIRDRIDTVLEAGTGEGRE